MLFPSLERGQGLFKVGLPGGWHVDVPDDYPKGLDLLPFSVVGLRTAGGERFLEQQLGVRTPRGREVRVIQRRPRFYIVGEIQDRRVG